MQIRSSTITFFTGRQLRKLQLLYRSRELNSVLKTISRVNNNTPKAKETQKDFIYLAYGTRSGLSPNQRVAFRSKLSSFNQFPANSVKFSLFATPISNKLASFSYLQHMRSRMKGTCYQRLIHVFTGASSSNEQLRQQMTPFFNSIKGIRFSEESFMDFVPSIVRFPTNSGTLVPRRFAQSISFSGANTSKQDRELFQATQRVAPSYFIVYNILYQLQQRHSKLIILFFYWLDSING